MKLFIKQKVFTLGESFTVKNEFGTDVFYVEGSFLRIPKRFSIYNVNRKKVATIESQLFRLMSHYDIHTEFETVTVKQNFTFFRPEVSIVGRNWTLQGDFFAHEYRLLEGQTPIMRISKHWFTWGDSYMLDVKDEKDALLSLCIVIVVDHIIQKSKGNS